MFGLIDQLRFFLNKSINVTEVVGFYVPVKKGYIIKMVCEWSDMELKYMTVF